MQIYNSLTNKLEEFKPLKEKELKMYVCGPTVYNYIHIGNARPIIFFDIVANYFRFLNYNVIYASNITDIDDKIIKKAIEEKKTEKEVANFYSKQYFKDYLNTNSILPTVTPYATDYINDIISYIDQLIKEGYAYEKDGDVYFRVNKLKNYGVLSNQVLDELNVGARIKEDIKKEDPRDFTLWKKTNEGIKWESPFGFGRPGWHTECVVMNEKVFHGRIDIHGGGADLKFPHHENEIAQSQALHHHNIANYWMHVGRVNLGNEKMSKSLGNIIWLRDLFEKYNPNSYRLLILNHSYRSEIKYTDSLIKDFEKEYQKLNKTIKNAQVQIQLNNYQSDLLDIKYLKEFEKEMDNDFNTPNVISIINELIKNINIDIKNKNNFIIKYNSLIKILNVLNLTYDYIKLEKEDIDLYKKWEFLRENKNFTEADIIRKHLLEKGIL